MSNDHQVPESDFNSAFQAMRGEMRAGFTAIGERLHGVESFQQAQLLAKIEEAKVQGGESNKVQTLEARVDKIESRIFGVILGFISMVLWWVFERAMGKGH